MRNRMVLVFVFTSLLVIIQGCEYSDQVAVTSMNSSGQLVETVSDQYLSNETCMFLETGTGPVRLELGSDQQVALGSTITVICKLSGTDLERFPWYFHVEQPTGSVRNEPIMTSNEWQHASSYGGVFQSRHTFTCNSPGKYHVAMTVGSAPFRRADIQVNRQ